MARKAISNDIPTLNSGADYWPTLSVNDEAISDRPKAIMFAADATATLTDLNGDELTADFIGGVIYPLRPYKIDATGSTCYGLY